jgi:hypothetical protein
MPPSLPSVVAARIQACRAEDADTIRRFRDRDPLLEPWQALRAGRVVQRYAAALPPAGTGPRRSLFRCAVCGEAILCASRYAATTHGPMHLACYDLAAAAFAAVDPGAGFAGTERVAEGNT